MNVEGINLKSLSHRISKKISKAGKDLGDLAVERDTEWKEFEFLGENTVAQLACIQQALDELVPNDFEFNLWFNGNKCMLSVSYYDGNTHGCGSNLAYKSWESIGRDLSAQDWDERRVDAIQANQVWDIFLAEAEKNPPSVRTVHEVQNDHIDLLRELKEKEAEDENTWSVYAFGGSFGELVHEACPDYRSVIGAMGDMMATEHEIVGVFREGLLISQEEIESLKRETLEDLGPISRAKAERRMPWSQEL